MGKKTKKLLTLADLPCRYCGEKGLEWWDDDGWLLWCPHCDEKFRADYYRQWYNRNYYYIDHSPKEESKKSKPKKDYSNFNRTYDEIEEGCGWFTCGGIVLAIIIGLIGCIVRCSCSHNDSNTQTKIKQREEKTLVQTIISEEDYKIFHEASKEEFKGKDTIFYYHHVVYQNKTGKQLALYSVEYCIDGSSTTEIINTFNPNQYFDAPVVIPFQQPPTSIDIPIPSGNSRWARSQRTKAKSKRYFLDYPENIHRR